jgi:ADP-ribose pyrophosphatase
VVETVQLPLSVGAKDLVYQDRARKVYKVVARFDGFTKEYYVSDHGQRAAIVVVQDSNVLLVRQYRLLINALSYEIPGGAVDKNESPHDAAVRECLEETGVKCSNLKQLLNYHVSLDTHKNYTHIFYSEHFEQTPLANPDRRIWIPLNRCIQMIFKGRIIDSLSIIALLAYSTLQRKGRL